jgi:hypothetical protein
MAEETFDPIRILAELNTLGVRYVLVADPTDGGAGSVLTSDRIEICVADDDDDISRLRAGLVSLEAEPDGPSDDPHRARFRTPLGRLELSEMPADTEFAELERRAGRVDLGHGVIVRAATRLDVSAHREGTEPEKPDRRTQPASPVPRRIWQRLEPKLERIDDLLSGLGGRPPTDPSR